MHSWWMAVQPVLLMIQSQVSWSRLNRSWTGNNQSKTKPQLCLVLQQGLDSPPNVTLEQSAAYHIGDGATWNKTLSMRMTPVELSTDLESERQVEHPEEVENVEIRTQWPVTHYADTLICYSIYSHYLFIISPSIKVIRGENTEACQVRIVYLMYSKHLGLQLARRVAV